MQIHGDRRAAEHRTLLRELYGEGSRVGKIPRDVVTMIDAYLTEPSTMPVLFTKGCWTIGEERNERGGVVPHVRLVGKKNRGQKFTRVVFALQNGRFHGTIRFLLPNDCCIAEFLFERGVFTLRSISLETAKHGHRTYRMSSKSDTTNTNQDFHYALEYNTEFNAVSYYCMELEGKMIDGRLVTKLSVNGSEIYYQYIQYGIKGTPEYKESLVNRYSEECHFSIMRDHLWFTTLSGHFVYYRHVNYGGIIETRVFWYRNGSLKKETTIDAEENRKYTWWPNGRQKKCDRENNKTGDREVTEWRPDGTVRRRTVATANSPKTITHFDASGLCKRQFQVNRKGRMHGEDRWCDPARVDNWQNGRKA